MSDYRPPVREMLYVIDALAGLGEVAALPGCAEATPDLAEAILDEAAQLAAEVIAPTNTLGDAEGARVEDGRVVVPEAFTAAYRQYVEGGWGGLTAPQAHGGQDLPFLVGVAVEEMWCAANLAWSLCPLLTAGAARAILAHAPDSLQQVYLPPMVAGEWTGTMNLTEPQAGSDLAAVRSQAVPEGDHYRVSGQKIFITWGDHEMAANVVHLVLARLPDAPEGVRGLSLFLVPKFIPAADGTPGERNAVRAVSVEHKLGIHGSPTCVMAFEGAVGHRIGEPHGGLAAMFTMMNHARLGVGLEGVAVAERAYQQACTYAFERVQGRTGSTDARGAIVGHPDVRRMLMTMRAGIEAMRALAYVTAAELDHAHRHPDPAQRARHQARLDLMTPVVKGWCTEMSQVLTSIALQIHGGMGYVEETGVAQYLRDARITTIYEGTTGIQANDLVGRKILRDGGAALRALLGDMQATGAELARHADLADIRAAHDRGCDELGRAAQWLATHHGDDPRVPGAVAWHLLMMLGTVAGGWQLARSALVASERLAGSPADAAFWHTRIRLARFYCGQMLPQATAHCRALTDGTAALLAVRDEDFQGA